MLTELAVKADIHTQLKGLSVAKLQPVVCLLYCILYMRFGSVGFWKERLFAETQQDLICIHVHKGCTSPAVDCLAADCA